MKRAMPIAFPTVLLILILASASILTLPSVLALPARAEERYTLKVRLDPEGHILTGSQRVEYHNGSQRALDSLYFILLPNFSREKNPYLDGSYIDQEYWEGFDPSWMEIERVAMAGGGELPYELMESPPELQTYSLKDTILRVELPEPLEPGQTTSVEIEFATKFPHMVVGDMCHHREIYTWRFGWNPIAVPARSLAEGFPRSPAEEYFKFELPAAWYEVELTLPEAYILAAGAERQELIDEGEGWKTYKLSNSFPVRSVPFTAGPNFSRYRLEHDGIAIEVYYLPGHEAPARLLATYAAEILDYYEELYGPTDYKRVVIAESSARGLFGMGANGLIILGDSWFREKDLGVRGLLDRFTEYVLAHELAHLYFGIGVGVDFNAENFLSEAFAQYLSITYYEEKYGAFGPNVFVFERKGLLQSLIEHYLGFYNLRQHSVELPYLAVFKDRFDEAIIKPLKEVEYGNWSYVRWYDKGYLVLRALASELGREKMRELLKRAHQEYKHRIFTTADLQQLAEELSGRELDEFFQDWLYGAEFVDYGIKRVKTEAKDGRYLTKVELVRRGGAALPVEVVVRTSAGEELKQIWDAEGSEGVIEFESSSPIRRVQVDPEELTPDVNRLDNSYPMKFRVITTGKNDLPLDAYLLRFDPAAQTIEGGTLWHRWLLGQGFGAFVVYLGRGTFIRGHLDLRPVDQFGTITGALELQQTFFSHPEVGLPAKFWEPTDRLKIAAGRVLDPEPGRGVNYLSLAWTRRETIQDLYSFSAELLGYLDLSFGRLSLESWRRFRLAPHLYLEEEVKLGLGYNLPGPFRFDLGELKSFYRREGEEWLKEGFPGNVKLSGRLALSFPLRREMDYDLAGLAVIDDVREEFFLSFGQTWEGLTGLNFAELKLEIGAEGQLIGRTLGGLFPVSGAIGLAYPLLGASPEARRVQIYIELQLPF